MNQSKELFEKLGYVIDKDDEYCISYVNKETGTRVTFYYEDMIFSVQKHMNDPILGNYFLKIAQINMSLLQAINKQCEELNWRKENESNSNM